LLNMRRDRKVETQKLEKEHVGRIAMKFRSKVSVIIVNYNGKTVLDDCINSVLRSDYPSLEIIVVDNASTDGSQEIIRELFPQVRLIANRKNLGYAPACNLGCRLATGQYLLFLNNDASLDTHCIEELVRLAQTDDKIAVIQPKIYIGSTQILQTAGSFLFYPISKTYFRGYMERDFGQYGRVIHTSYACGAALFARRKIIDEIGMFDGDYLFYFEDSDFSWRARLAGYSVAYCPTAKVWHLYRYSMKKASKDLPSMLYYSQRNRLVTNLKNYGSRALLAWILIEPLSFLGMALIGANYAKTYLMAICYLIRNLSSVLKKRRLVQALRKSADSQILETHLPLTVSLLKKSLAIL